MFSCFRKKIKSKIKHLVEHTISENNSIIDNIITAQINQLKQQYEDLQTKISILNSTNSNYEGIHEHIDTVQRDLLIVMNKISGFAKNEDIILETDFPIAVNSPDYLSPYSGNRNNYSRHPRFIRACEQHFHKSSLSFLDLGCAGGGIVFDAILRGHKGVGLEGSDFSLLAQRADWRLLKDNLFTCDIAKPFTLLDKKSCQPAIFDVISAFEVMEHIHETDMETLLANIIRHMGSESIFVASISKIPGGGVSSDGRDLHQTIKPLSWWIELFENFHLKPLRNILDTPDFARGNGNKAIFWSRSSYGEKLGDCFLLTFGKENG